MSPLDHTPRDLVITAAGAAGPGALATLEREPHGLDRPTVLALAAVTAALADANITTAEARAPLGLVLGSSTGSLVGLTAFVRDTFVHSKPYHVNPSHFPNTVLNAAAGWTAVWRGLKGLNTTLAAGACSSYAALQYASRMIRAGRAEALLVGAVEEASFHAGQTPREEAAGIVLLETRAAAERAGRTVKAQLIAVSCVDAPLALPAGRDTPLPFHGANGIMRLLNLLAEGRSGESSASDRDPVGLTASLRIHR